MSDDLLILLARRASGHNLNEKEQAALEAALLEDPDLLDVLVHAQAAVSGQAPMMQQTWLIWAQRAAFSGLFFLLFSVGLTLGGGLVTSGNTAFATEDYTFSRGAQSEQRALTIRKRDKS